MAIHRIGLTLLGMALVIYSVALPMLPNHDLYASPAHALVGLLLGTGVTLMIGAAFKMKRGL